MNSAHRRRASLGLHRRVTKTGAKSAGPHKNDAIPLRQNGSRLAIFSATAANYRTSDEIRQAEFRFVIPGDACTPAEVQWLARCGEAARAREVGRSIALGLLAVRLSQIERLGVTRRAALKSPTNGCRGATIVA
jgi:hypothetical protein